jgi:hypothetical protein
VSVVGCQWKRSEAFIGGFQTPKRGYADTFLPIADTFPPPGLSDEKISFPNALASGLVATVRIGIIKPTPESL